VTYPRVFTGAQLAQISFPLGGIGTGCIGLGGRGQLRDWEIFNRPDKGNAPGYAFPAIRVDRGGRAPLVSVLEARLQPPYQGAFGLGSRSAPGLQRLQGATFTGEFPLARVAFRDRRLPVSVTLDAFSPFIPHEEDDSGLPVAILRYTVTNKQSARAKVSIAYSIENLMLAASLRRGELDPRVNERKSDGPLSGILMRNPTLPADHPLAGSLGLWTLEPNGGRVSTVTGWPRARWWTSALHFWDDFSADGELGPDSADPGPVAAVCLQHDLAPGASATYTFLITWNYPNRTPDRCGWDAPEGQGASVIGNFYCTRFADAWETARYAASNLERLESRTRLFADAFRQSTLPAGIKDAASANLSTLVTQTAFRTADGEFHGFEGCGDQSGCCMGNCTHVWNYETTTQHLFPAFAHSLRRAAFGYSMDEDGGMRFRQMLPDGFDRFPTAAADGQMGQIIKVYLDWQLSGDRAYLEELWPKVKRAIGFAWIEGGWDADRDGVLEGAQHNTYDIEFFGPNPLCGIYYLGALRAVEEMAREMSDDETGREARRLFESGRSWIDANLFNGEYYVQQVKGQPREQIAPALMNTMGSDRTDEPEYQMGTGCLVDQLVGQYQAEAAGLGPLVDVANCRKALESIHRYNSRRDLFEHDSVQRTYVLNDEAALIIAEYAHGGRPNVPFPYYAEAWTGLEYTAASHMVYAGMVSQGIECITNARARYDGERRNPWDEAECGSHYARAMSAWTAVLAASGFRYDGPRRRVTLLPRLPVSNFQCFWSTGTGWGTFHYGPGGQSLRIKVLHGQLSCRAVLAVDGPSGSTRVTLDGQPLPHEVKRVERGVREVSLESEVLLGEGQELLVS
jgi:uncharacterized protein (DUF608 family)